MARAKRTDRAEARRRHRATQLEATEVESQEEDETPPAAPAKSSGKAAAAPSPRPAPRGGTTQPPPVRPSFTGSFRQAARPVDLRSDIRYIPDLVLHTRAVWIPAAAAVAATAAALISNGPNTLIALAVQLFLYPPTIAGAFLAGILAPRATYLAGGLAGLIGSILFIFLVVVAPNNLTALAGSTTPAASPSISAAASDASGSAAPTAAPTDAASAAPTPTPAPASTVDFTSAATASAIAVTIFESTIFGIAIGAFGGYYKRFLYLSNPSRQRKAMEQQRQKGQRQPTSKRRF